MFIDGLDKICMKCRGSTIVLNYNPPVLFFRSAFQEMSDQNAIISQGRARCWEGRWEGREGWREAGREADDREGEGEGGKREVTENRKEKEIKLKNGWEGKEIKPS